MKLSNQAIGALLLTLQKCLSEQIDITDLLSDWNLEVDAQGEIIVTNPPTVSPNIQPEKQMFETE
jgi:hypothetical protein